jgi:hypothetical protein
VTTPSPAHEVDVPVVLRPDGIDAIRRPGLVPRRLLMFGGGVLAGEGLASHSDGLPGAVADALAQRSRRGAEITVIVEPDPLSRRALDGLHGLRLHRFDAVIIVLGPSGQLSRTVPNRHGRDVLRLVALLENDCAERAPAFIYDSSPAMTPAPSHRPSAVGAPHGETATEEEPAVSRVRFRELPPQPAALGPAPPFSPVTYEGWAHLIAERLDLEIAELHTTLGPSTAPPGARPDDEAMRRRALESLHLPAGGPDERLTSLLRQAKVTFAAAGAALMIVGSDEVWPHAAVGARAPTLPRGFALSTIAVQSDRPTVISDARLDPRTTGTTWPSPTRFYAGYPIHTWDGYRIGALCIHDVTPRNVRTADLLQLWELAGQVEQHLWTSALRSGSRPGTTLPVGGRLQPAAEAEEAGRATRPPGPHVRREAIRAAGRALRSWAQGRSAPRS